VTGADALCRTLLPDLCVLCTALCVCGRSIGRWQLSGGYDTTLPVTRPTVHSGVDGARCGCVRAQVGDHEHITAIRDVLWDCVLPNKHGAGSKECVMVVMDIAQGGELFAFLKETGAFSEPVARVYFGQLMSGEARDDAASSVAAVLR
jgi:hypothetical protein